MNKTGIEERDFGVAEDHDGAGCYRRTKTRTTTVCPAMPNGEKQEAVADEETVALLKRFAGNPDVEKARAEFERAQRVEEKFHKVPTTAATVAMSP